MAAVEPLRPADELAAFEASVSGCTKCRLAQGRTQVVFGVGNPDADLMFVGEAPGFHEDKQGFPFVGQAGKLLEKLLVGIGMSRQDVFIANVLKCRPPGNRDPQQDEIEACESHFEELVRNGQDPECPDCGASNVRKQLSVFGVVSGATSQPGPLGGGRGGGCCGGSCGCG